MRNKRPLALAAAVTIAAWGLTSPSNMREVRYQSKPFKKCTNCGTEHQHNNRFCSAKCCREYES